MPYIKQENRSNLDKVVELFDNSLVLPFGPGDLNYLITRICHTYIYSRKEGYSTYNEVIGVLECAKLELYRREIVPYENRKIEENGDVA